MKIGKQYLGKYVEFTWKDPNSRRVKITEAPKGSVALATWRERGVIDDLTESVIRIAHSDACEPGATVPDEAVYSWVPEDLIVSITVYEPVKEGV